MIENLLVSRVAYTKETTSLQNLYNILSVLFLGTSLVTAQENSPTDPEDTSEMDSDPTASGSPDNFDQLYNTLHRWHIGPPPGKRSAIESSLGARNFVRGGEIC